MLMLNNATVAILLLLLLSSVRAADINAASGSPADIEAAYATATHGDRIIVPAGTNYWERSVTLTNKLVTLQGAGRWMWAIDGTGTNTYATNLNPTATVFVDELTNRAASSNYMFYAYLYTNNPNNVDTNHVFRLTGFEFRQGTTNTATMLVGLKFMGSNARTNNIRYRIDHNKIAISGRHNNYARSHGVWDHNYIDFRSQAGIVVDGRVPDALSRGDEQWSLDVLMGTVNEGVFYEDNYYTNQVQRGITDGFTGAQYVVRSNRIDTATVQNHGTDSTGRFRGTRWMSSYGNWIRHTGSMGDAAHHFRSGSGNIYSNTIVGNFPSAVRLFTYRLLDWSNPWGMANGTNSWDTNDMTVYYSEPFTGSDGDTLFTSSGASFPSPNGLIGYSLVLTNDLGGPDISNSGSGGLILSNSATDIRLVNHSDGAINKYTNGWTAKIMKVLRAIDAPGNGKGLLASNSTPVINGVAQWPLQEYDGVYVWGNTGFTNVTTGSTVPDYTMVEGSNYVYAARSGYTAYQYPHEIVAQTDAQDGAGTLSFSAATYSVGESDGTVTITVTRTVGSVGAVTVDYDTSNGTATEGDDYDQATGTLSWMDGETDSKTFDITITNDSEDEPGETVILTLSGETGGVVLGTDEATLTISDDDITPSAATGKGRLIKRPRR